MGRLALVSGWLLAGHAVVGGLYWSLLLVPEASAWMLALSAVLVIALLVAASAVQAGAVLAWHAPSPAWRSLPCGLRRAPWVAPAVVLFALGWWATARIEAAHLAGRAALDASLMVRLGWAETTWVHRALTCAVFALRWGVTLPLAVALMTSGIVEGAGGVASPAWLRRALRPRAMIVTLAVVLLAMLAWQAVYWRPASLPPTQVELIFVAVKLGLAAAAMAAAWAIVLWAAVVTSGPEETRHVERGVRN